MAPPPMPPSIAAPVDERIEHEFEKFVGQLNRGSLSAGRDLARACVRPIGETVPKNCAGSRRSIEEIIQRIRDIPLVLIETVKLTPSRPVDLEIPCSRRS